MSFVSTVSFLPPDHPFHAGHNSFDFDGGDNANPPPSPIPLELEAGSGDRVPPSKFQAVVDFLRRRSRTRRGGTRDSGLARQRRKKQWGVCKAVVDVISKIVAIVVGVITIISIGLPAFKRKYD